MKMIWCSFFLFNNHLSLQLLLRKLIFPMSSPPTSSSLQNTAKFLQNARKGKLVLLHPPLGSHHNYFMFICLRSNSSAAHSIGSHQFTQVPMCFWKYLRFWLSRGWWQRRGRLQKDEQQRCGDSSGRGEFCVRKNESLVVAGGSHHWSGCSSEQAVWEWRSVWDCSGQDV